MVESKAEENELAELDVLMMMVEAH